MTERCCPSGQCAYRVEAVEHYLSVLGAFAAAREDPSRPMRGRPYDRSPGGGMVGNEGDELLDVQCAVKALRAAGKEVSAVSVAMKLCPWSLE